MQKQSKDYCEQADCWRVYIMIKLFKNNVKQKKLKQGIRFNRFNFCYYEVNKNCNLQSCEINDWESFFGDEYKEIYSNMQTVSSPAYDSGLVLLDGVSSEYPLRNIYMKYAPYKMLLATTNHFANEIETSKKSDCLKRMKKQKPFIARRRNIEQLSVGVGMVLCIVATKGSAFRLDNRPYVLLLKRANKIRNSQLDVSVVEGLNCSDFNKKANDVYNTANLDEIAIRALKEERGIQYELLKNRKLIHMPQKYYLGLDKDYNQWNFFGTIKIDCTIEEIIREGFYSTIDKYETNEVLGLPMEPAIVFHYLSQEKMKVNSSNGLVEFSHKGMWETGWASIIFAFMDLNIKYKKQLFRLGFGKNKRISKLRTKFVHLLDMITEAYNNHPFIEMALSIISAFFALFSVVYNILSYVKNQNIDSTAQFVSELSSLTLAIMFVIKSREKFCNLRDFVYIILSSTQSKLDNIHEISELSTFRNVSILDGNIYDINRNIDLSVEKSDSAQQSLIISAWRNCMAFDETDSNGKCNWVLKKENQTEHIKWVLKYNNKFSHIRFVFSLVVDDEKIAFRKRDNNIVKSYIDVLVPVYELIKNSENNVLNIYSNDSTKESTLKKIFSSMLTSNLEDVEIIPKFLLKSTGTYTISGFIKMRKVNIDSLDVICKHMSTNLMSTSFADSLDDVNRVVTELTLAEFVGYTMS